LAQNACFDVLQVKIGSAVCAVAGFIQNTTWFAIGQNWVENCNANRECCRRWVAKHNNLFFNAIHETPVIYVYLWSNSSTTRFYAQWTSINLTTYLTIHKQASDRT